MKKTTYSTTGFGGMRGALALCAAFATGMLFVSCMGMRHSGAGGEVTGASFYTGGTLNGSTYFQTIDDTQLAAYGGTLSGGTQSTGSGSGNTPTNPWG